MFNSVKKNYKKNDVVLMCAAVADYKPVKIYNDKIKKDTSKENLKLELTQTQDILKYLGDNKGNVFLIGFALEVNNEIRFAKEKLRYKNLDMIVLNNPNVEGAGFGTETNVITLIDKKSVKKLPLLSKYEAGNAILDYYIKNKKRSNLNMNI